MSAPTSNTPAAAAAAAPLPLGDCDLPVVGHGARMRGVRPAERGAELPGLQSLDLTWCECISDAGLAHLGRLATLQELNLSWCGRVTDAGLRHLANLGSLKSLCLAGCRGISDAGLRALDRPGWRRLDLAGCPGLSPRAVQAFRAAHPDCVVEH